MSERFTFHPTALEGAILVERHPHRDDRGYLERLFAPEEFAEISIGRTIQQINHTLTRQAGTVRGLHFQHPPYAEAKLVTCLRGRIFDVAVDLRAGSSTFLQWHGEILAEDNFRSFLIPEGFAHGFQTLTGDCELLYLHSASYNQGAEGGLHPEEARIGIRWPQKIAELSARDISHPRLDADYLGVTL